MGSLARQSTHVTLTMGAATQMLTAFSFTPAKVPAGVKMGIEEVD